MRRLGGPRAKATLACLAVSLTLAVAAIPGAAHADGLIDVKTNGGQVEGGNCWNQDYNDGKDMPFWCPNQWTGTAGPGGSGARMTFDLNDHTSDANQWDGLAPMVAWGQGFDYAMGISGVSVGWDYDGGNGVPTSPVQTVWSSGTNRMQVGIYPWNGGYSTAYGRVILYRAPGPIDAVTKSDVYDQATKWCDQPWGIHYARLYINRNMVHNTPPWYFYRLVQHEMGHVFGLCEVSNKETVMSPPQAINLDCDWDPDYGSTVWEGVGSWSGGAWDYDSCFGKTTDDIVSSQWDEDGPEPADFSNNSNCFARTKAVGLRCIYKFP
ncbi:MAG: hypothetical protein ACT4QF_24995 [Sporichthyaceae bacterium]